MTRERVFIDWRKPILPAVVDDLLQSHQSNSAASQNVRNGPAASATVPFVDLSRVLAVFPGRQAGRRFLELLVQRTQGRCVPPEIITVGRLPEFLYSPQRPFADELTQQLAWSRALRQLSVEQLARLIPRRPAEDDTQGWLTLGAVLSSLHQELAAEQLHFGDVASRLAEMASSKEQERWRSLREAQRYYLDILDALQLWDQQTARLVAIEQQECRCDATVLLIGAVDLNRTLRAMLAQSQARILAYVHAPAELSHRFDEFGCLIAEEWAHTSLNLPLQQISVVDRFEDQAAAVVQALIDLEGRFRPEEVTIGVPDPQVVPFVQRALEEHALPSWWVIERQLSETGPFKFFESLVAYLPGQRTAQFAALVRHPAVSRWLDRQGLPINWLTELDCYLGSHAPRVLREFLGVERSGQVVKRLYQLVARWISPLSGGERPLPAWMPILNQLLIDLYGRNSFDLEDPAQRVTHAACEQLQGAMSALQCLPADLSPVTSGDRAIKILLSSVADEVIPPGEIGPAVTLAGWLELALDDAPVLILTGCNEGSLPSTLNHDMFLPDGLRTGLGLTNNAHRFARDLYTLQALLQSRKQLQIVVGRRDANQEPLRPSRLLFATEPEAVVERVQHCFREPVCFSEISGPARRSDLKEVTALVIPRPEPLSVPKDTFRVTEFADFLASPYRYYLRHILKLEDLSDSAQELNPAGFGSLIHKALSEFGRSHLTQSIDAGEIRQVLDRALDQQAAIQFGKYPLYPIRLQVEQARLRLHDFAAWQADWAKQGWQLRFSEASLKEPAWFGVDAEKGVWLRGRIDRIDFHPRDKTWMIIDYKTGEEAADPQKSHQSREAWVDLQLPLYRHLALPLGVEGSVQLAYVLLPKEAGQVKLVAATWDDKQLREADEVARDVIRRVWNGDFWQELAAHPQRMMEYDVICQSHVAENRVIL